MPIRLYKILIILTILAVIAGAFAYYFTFKADKNLEVDFLDVGQGDSILIKTPFGQNILIDGGPDDKAMKQISKNLAWWDKKIDLMILTHPHDDHVTGEIDVLKRFKVKKVIYTGVTHTSPNYQTWLNIIKDKNIPLLILNQPQKINFGVDCYLDIIYPGKDLSGQKVDDLNSTSIVAKLIFKNTSFLLTGDIGNLAEKELMDKKINLSANVLKVGHHGSDYGTGEEFLNAVNPKIAVISVGANNDFGHPSLRVLKRLERMNINTYRTDLAGTIKIMSNGQSVKKLE